eukprot:766692-Hanusia_phi.AAC.5
MPFFKICKVTKSCGGSLLSLPCPVQQGIVQYSSCVSQRPKNLSARFTDFDCACQHLPWTVKSFERSSSSPAACLDAKSATCRPVHLVTTVMEINSKLAPEASEDSSLRWSDHLLRYKVTPAIGEPASKPASSCTMFVTAATDLL